LPEFPVELAVLSSGASRLTDTRALRWRLYSNTYIPEFLESLWCFWLAAPRCFAGLLLTGAVLSVTAGEGLSVAVVFG
jgi:hypothetical protein